MREIAFIIAFMPLMLLVAVLSAKEPETFYKAKVEHVIDGDTVRASFSVELLGVDTKPQSIRSTFDAWEVSRSRQSEPFKSFTDKQWQEEISKGTKARDALVKLLETHELFAAPTKQKESFGRPIMRWVAYNPETGKRIELAEWMQNQGHVRIGN